VLKKPKNISAVFNVF